jgi:hypothetical protein
MEKTINALNKIQESKQGRQNQKSSELFYIKEDLHADFKNAVAVIVAILTVGIIAAVFMNDKMNDLEKIVKMQESRIDGLTALLINKRNLSDSQIQNFIYRLKDEADVRKIEINNMALVDNVYYVRIMKAILANTHQIDDLNAYTKNLNDEIEKTSASIIQAKQLPIPK